MDNKQNNLSLEQNKPPQTTGGSQLYDWACFINAKSEEELDAIVARNPQMGNAVAKLKALSADKNVRDMYDRREKSRCDEESQMRWARQEGREEGKQEGR